MLKFVPCSKYKNKNNSSQVVVNKIQHFTVQLCVIKWPVDRKSNYRRRSIKHRRVPNKSANILFANIICKWVKTCLLKLFSWVWLSSTIFRTVLMIFYHNKSDLDIIGNVFQRKYQFIEKPAKKVFLACCNIDPCHKITFLVIFKT